MTNISRLVYIITCLSTVAIFSGCVATSREMVDLKEDIYQLQVKLNEVQKNQADLSAKMDIVASSMDALTAELLETQGSMSLLSQRIDDVESNLSRKMSRISNGSASGKSDYNHSALSSPSPSKIYQLAYSDFSSGKYDLAIVGFRSYIDDYPNGELAHQAQYYLAECYYAQNSWDKAFSEFKKVEQYYPSSDLKAASRLKQAFCMDQMDKVEEYQDLLESVVKDFPKSPEAFTAKEKLEAYTTDGE